MVERGRKEKMDKITLINDDVIKGLQKLESETVDLIIADPPYNLSKNYVSSKDNLSFEDYIAFTTNWLKESVRVLKPGGTIYVFMGMQMISYLFTLLEDEFELSFSSWITWHYTQGVGKKRGWSSRHDDILMFTKGDNYIFNLDEVRVPQKFYRSINNMRGANPGNVWTFSHVHYSQNNRSKQHPTQKPEGLIERMVLASSNVGDVVLDPFSGSGTTMRVVQQTDRIGIGIELERIYIDETYERLKKDFIGFDSIDERMLRIPNDLNDSIVRLNYLKNHLTWFLSRHQSNLEEVITNYIEKYSLKLSFEEIEFLTQLIKNKKLKISKHVMKILE